VSAALENPFRGSLVALPTPFQRQHVDFESLWHLVELQVQGGSHGVVAGGSTGEGASLSRTERTSVIAFTAGAAAGRLPVIAGVGASSTRVAVELAEEAQRAGANGLLVTTPIYVRPPQRGIVEHFCAVADATPLPVILYDIPQRTGVALQPETAAAVRERCANVVAVKESAGVEQVQALVEVGIDVLCGEDGWIVEGMQAGAVGAISVVGNLVPKRMVELIQAIGTDATRAAHVLERVRPLIRALALETNPAPLKAALARLGFCEAELRLPLVGLESANLERLEAALRTCELL
jgi:4-hydroxy-tetrahydrodipicolinate synthase